MDNETILEMIYRVAIAGEASPSESFMVLSSLAIALFAVVALGLLLLGRAAAKRKLEARAKAPLKLEYYVRP